MVTLKYFDTDSIRMYTFIGKNLHEIYINCFFDESGMKLGKIPMSNNKAVNLGCGFVNNR